VPELSKRDGHKLKIRVREATKNDADQRGTVRFRNIHLYQLSTLFIQKKKAIYMVPMSLMTAFADHHYALLIT
jgi:hypothetical protein